MKKERSKSWGYAEPCDGLGHNDLGTSARQPISLKDLKMGFRGLECSKVRNKRLWSEETKALMLGSSLEARSTF